MDAPPFGLSPQAFSIIMVAGWLILGPLVASFFMRKRTRRILTAGAAAQAMQEAPAVYPSLTPPNYRHLVGVWQYKSATRWIGIVLGAFTVLTAFQFPTAIAAPTVAVGLLLIGYPFWRAKRPAQQCSVDPSLRVVLSRGGRDIPLDLNHYRYVRMHVSSSRSGRSYPSMMVFDRDSYPGFLTLFSSTLFPRFDDARMVLFHNRWWTADGGLVPPGLVDDFFRDVCRRSGVEPAQRKTLSNMGSNPPWEIRPY